MPNAVEQSFIPKKLGVSLIEDTALAGGKRWVLVSPPNSNGTHLLLAQTSTTEHNRASPSGG